MFERLLPRGRRRSGPASPRSRVPSPPPPHDRGERRHRPRSARRAHPRVRRRAAARRAPRCPTPRDPLPSRGLPHGLTVAQATAKLHGHLRLRRDAPHVVEVLRLARARAVEVYDMERTGSLVQPAARRVDGIVVVHGLASVVALREPYRVPVADVDCRVEDHAGTDAQISAKLARIRSPAALDFSGWNCTPYKGGRATAHANRSPHSAVPSTSSLSAGLTANECTK